MQDQEYTCIELFETELKPSIDKYNRVSYSGKIEGLNSVNGMKSNLSLSCNSENIFIKGSLHSFYSGANHTDFTYTMLREVIDYLDCISNGELLKARLYEIEYGVNFTNNINYKEWQDYKGNSFDPMKKGSTQYGAKSEFGEFSIKHYDKKLQFKLDKNKNAINEQIYRYEKKVKPLRILRNSKSKIQINFLEDLSDNQIMIQLGNDLIKSTEYVNVKDSIDLTGTSTKDKSIVAYMENESIRKIMKIEHFETYRKDRLRYRKLKKTNSNKTMLDITSIVGAKVNHLLVK